jgi:hypothetical protein
MTVIQTRNAEAAALESTDHLSTNDRNFSAEWLDAVGGQSTSEAVTVTLATQVHNFAPEVFDMASNILTILEGGFYQLAYTIYVQKSGSNEGSFYAFLEEDPATGTFTEIPGTRSTATAFNGPASGSSLTNRYVLPNYRYRLRFATFGVTFSTVGGFTKLSAVRFFKNG